MPKHGSGNKKEPISVWKEVDSLNERDTTAHVMILNGPGCSWAAKCGCLMCGYNEPGDQGSVSKEELIMQTATAMENYNGESYIKIFTSGSFLDGNEIPPDVQTAILKHIGHTAGNVRVLVESRPEYITEDSLSRLSDIEVDLEIAIGLETASDAIRMEMVRKGFSYEQYLNSARLVTDSGLSLKTYLLLKPPMLGESSSLDDCITSIKCISREFPGSRISINPMNIQSDTYVEKLFNNKLYRPPWLWSLVEVLRTGHQLSGGRVHLMSSPTGGGRSRGAHNCGSCDREVLGSILKFSIKNDPKILPNASDCCQRQWKEHLSSSLLSPVGSDMHLDES
ncbi:MAG: archaeosine biosynthesis radical SAM protein RaSEA [Thermoplasmatota archaeon]